MAKNKKTCYVIGPVDTAGSELRQRADKIMRVLIAPALKDLNYGTPGRADESRNPGMITIEICDHLITDDLVIADLSCPNPNVYYELGVRQAFHKPSVLIIEKGHKTPFDTKDIRHVEFTFDVDDIKNATHELHDAILALENPQTKINTPISVAAQLASLRSGTDTERMYADLLTAILDTRASLLKSQAENTALLLRSIVPHLISPEVYETKDGRITRRQPSLKLLREFFGNEAIDACLAYSPNQLSDITPASPAPQFRPDDIPSPADDDDT
jgi:hypothetical protein